MPNLACAAHQAAAPNFPGAGFLAQATDARTTHPPPSSVQALIERCLAKELQISKSFGCPPLPSPLQKQGSPITARAAAVPFPSLPSLRLLSTAPCLTHLVPYSLCRRRVPFTVSDEDNREPVSSFPSASVFQLRRPPFATLCVALSRSSESRASEQSRWWSNFRSRLRTSSHHNEAIELFASQPANATSDETTRAEFDCAERATHRLCDFCLAEKLRLLCCWVTLGPAGSE